MKFFHISDLHIGKRVNGFSMMEDQKYILNEIIKETEKHKPDGIWIAGDLYDKSMPSGEAVEMLDWFLTELAARRVPVWAISGNHDSSERVAYGGKLMEQAGIHMSRIFDGTLQKYAVGEVDIYLMPFLKPVQVRRFFPDRSIETTQQAVEAVLENTELAGKERVSVLLMHQFLLGAQVCESEELSIGGSDQIDVSLVKAFDYVALGHLHGPQKVGRETVRYSGSPLKYSFSEAYQKKAITVVEIKKTEKEEYSIMTEQIPLTPLRDMREIKGPIEQLISPEVYLLENREDYLHVTLTDENEIIDAIGKLREVYPNIMRLDFAARQMDGRSENEVMVEEKTPQELFAAFFEMQNGIQMSGKQQEIVDKLFQEMQGGR